MDLASSRHAERRRAAPSTSTAGRGRPRRETTEVEGLTSGRETSRGGKLVSHPNYFIASSRRSSGGLISLVYGADLVPPHTQ